ncbi:hypothetical protein PVAG01_07699 [Phlyctema vagabunda]|uniref:ATP synthase F0 subunit 8 n=1 Tax=Phlyctema vagabunda TaxID=108571 RepID=A0ABR4PD66_9HELO
MLWRWLLTSLGFLYAKEQKPFFSNGVKNVKSHWIR